MVFSVVKSWMCPYLSDQKATKFSKTAWEMTSDMNSDRIWPCAIVFHHMILWEISTSQSDHYFEHILMGQYVMWIEGLSSACLTQMMSTTYEPLMSPFIWKWLGYRPRHDTIQHLSISMRQGPHRSSLCERQMRRSLFEHHGNDLVNMFAQLYRAG